MGVLGSYAYFIGTDEKGTVQNEFLFNIPK